MWMISLFAGHLILPILLLGLGLVIVSSLVGFIPTLKSYKLLLGTLGWIMFGLGLYWQGGLAYKKSQEEAVAQLQKKLDIAQAKSEQVNTQVVTRIVKDTKVIHDKGQALIQYIDRDVVKYDSTCIVPQDVIDAHNHAVTLDLPSSLSSIPPKTEEQPKPQSATKTSALDKLKNSIHMPFMGKDKQ